MKKYKYTEAITFDGHRYYIRGDTKKEIHEKRETKLKELETGRVRLRGEMLLKDWIPVCIRTYKTNQKAITRKKYEARVRKCITEEIGHMKLNQVRPLHLQDCLNRQAGRSKTQINEVYQALKFIFEKAVQNNMILSNPADHLVRPAGVKKQRRALTEDERETFIQVAKTDRRYYIYLLMLFCGCRPEEAGNVKRSDISEVRGIQMLHIRGTKTVNADRFVPVPDALWQIVKDLPANDYIACNSLGNPISYDRRKRVWDSFTRQVEIAMGAEMYRNALVTHPLDPEVSPYCLRHTYCTMLAKKGVDIRTAQKLMGHSDISITANIYTHVDHDDIALAARLIEA